jgi:nitroreductase
MTDNSILQTIRARRSVRNFAPDPVTDEQLTAILDAGRWAPSARNSQPWDFVVVRDATVRAAISEILRKKTYAWRGFALAPVMIVVSVDRSRDPDHFVEDGAVAAQNICLAAASMGLASSWAGVYAPGSGRRSTESALRRLLSLPRRHRVIAVIPVGTARNVGKAGRRPLDEMVHYDRFRSAPKPTAAETPSPEPDREDTSRQLLPEKSPLRPVSEPARFM